AVLERHIRFAHRSPSASFILGPRLAATAECRAHRPATQRASDKARQGPCSGFGPGRGPPGQGLTFVSEIRYPREGRMHDSIEELYARWQSNPDPAQTAAMCEALRGSGRHDLVEIVGGHASKQLDVRALLAAARMYAGSGRLDDAQNVLVAAGRLDPRDGEIFCALGEVLLRRGDA